MAMPNIVFRCQMFRGDFDQVWSQLRMLHLMEALCRVNQTHFKQMEAFRQRGLAKQSYPSVYRAGLHYETEKGTEIWPDVPSLIEGTMGRGRYPGPWGDCLPVSTLVLMSDYSVKAVGNLVPGDVIMGDGNFTTVVEHAFTGDKPILAFDLNNGSSLRCSPEHRVFLRDGSEKRAEDVKVGDLLRTPSAEFPSGPELTRHGIDPRDFAWLLGAYVADGWAETPRHPRFSISGLDGHPKEEQKRRVQAIMKKISANTRWHERYVAVNHRELAEYMKDCGNHAPEKHLPSLLWSREQVVSLVEGLAADASMAGSGTRTHGTTSEVLALQLRILYRMLGQSVHIRRWDDHGGLGTHPVYRITVRMPSDPVWPNSRRDSAQVKAVRECEPEACCDITTDTGRFYLPESDVVVHNCEDLACYRVAELRELPFHYERVAQWDKKVTEVADPRFPQSSPYRPEDARPIEVPLSGPEDLKPSPAWAGWRRVEGGIRAKPFAKWRRGPTGNYHYHALTYLPDGRLEDPSLVLGMGREGEFASADTAAKLRGGAPVTLQYARAPEVMVVDPEKPSGYGGGIASQLDAKVLREMVLRGGVEGELPEVGAYLANEVRSDGDIDLDELVGWSREKRMFLPRSEAGELARMLGYAG